MKEFAVLFLQGTWGIVQNLAGGVIFLLHIREQHFYYKGSVVTFWDMPEMSLGIGMFIFLSKDYVKDGRGDSLTEPLETGRETGEKTAGSWTRGRGGTGSRAAEKERQWPEGEELRRIRVHEYGHTVQSALLGPLFLPLMGVPSFLWANLPACRRYRREKGVSYYSFYTERFANWLGERVTGEEAVR